MTGGMASEGGSQHTLDSTHCHRSVGRVAPPVSAAPPASTSEAKQSPRLCARVRNSLRSARDDAKAPTIAGHASSGFFRNASVMLAGTSLGQAASVALAPVLTRIYSAEEFGYLSVYTAVLAILGVTAALGLDQAIPLAASEFELANLTAAGIATVVATSGCIGLAMWLLPARALAALWLAPLDSHRYLLPLGLACLGSYYVMVAAATRAGRFSEIARTRVTQGIGGPLSQIALGALGFRETGLAIGFVFGQTSGVLLLASRVILRQPQLRNVMSRNGMQTVVARYRHFPLFTSWTRVFDMAGSGTVLYILFATYYSSEIVGFMFLAERVIARPLLMVSSSLLQVFSGEAGRTVRHDPGALARRFWQVVPGQLLFALAWIVPVNLLANATVPLLFGAAWVAAIPCVHALSLAYLALAVLHPVSTTLQLLNRQKLAAAWQMFRVAMLVCATVAAQRCGLSAVAALWVCSAIQALACSGMLATMAVCIHRVATAQPDNTSAQRTSVPLMSQPGG
jgi:O-antigen/teichoic acid export membrane protein